MKLWFQRVGAVLVALRRGGRSDVETARQLIHCALDLLPIEQRARLLAEFVLDNAKRARLDPALRARRDRLRREQFELRQRMGRA